MKELTREFLAELSCKVENFIALEIGQTVPYISMIFVPGEKDAIALFTNRRSDEEVIEALEGALRAVRGPEAQRFRSIEGTLE